jgi:hypothetical protein
MWMASISSSLMVTWWYWLLSRYAMTPPSGLGEQAWFRDSEGNLLGIGQPVR